MEFLFLDCLLDPALDHLLSAKVISFVPDKRIVRETGKNGFYVMRIAGVEVLLNDLGHIDIHADSRLRHLPDDLVGHPAIDQSASQVFGVKVVRKTKFNSAGFVERL